MSPSRSQSQDKKKKIDWVPTLFLTITPIAAVLSTALYLHLYEFSLWMVAMFVGLYFLTSISITAGYHRLFSHGAYNANKVVKLFYALFGAAAFQNSILKWSVDHRIHHRYVDKDHDPYSINKGFWYAHMGWMMVEADPIPHENAYSRDLKKDPIVMWQHNHYLLISIVMCFVLPTALGALAGSALGGFAIGGLLRLVAVHHGTFFINSLCHYWGRQTYTDQNSAKDSLLMAIFTCGEGYHNFHHLFANDYRNGIRWYHWDPTKWLIGALSYMGWATDLKKAPEPAILKAKMEMEEKRLEARLSDRFEAFSESLSQLKANVEKAQIKVRELRAEYTRLKVERTRQGHEKLAEIRLEMKRAKHNLRMALREWQSYTNSLYKVA